MSTGPDLSSKKRENPRTEVSDGSLILPESRHHSLTVGEGDDVRNHRDIGIMVRCLRVIPSSRYRLSLTFTGEEVRSGRVIGPGTPIGHTRLRCRNSSPRQLF